MTIKELAKELYPEDIYGMAKNLTDGELEVLKETRAALEKHLRPVINDYWERGALPSEQFYKVIEEVNYINDPRILQKDQLLPYSPYYTFFIAYELTKFDPSIATFSGVHSGLGLFSFLIGGSEEQRKRFVPDILSFKKQTCFALTEPEHGSDVAGGITTTAKKDGDHWILNGEKRWIGGASSADFIPVYAVDEEDGQVKCFVVYGDQPGVEIEDIKGKIALRIVNNGHITLKDVEVKEEDRLQNINSFRDVAKVLYLTRSGVAFTSTGALAGALEATKKYVASRVQFGRPIAKFQLVQEKLAIMRADLASCLAMCHEVIEQNAKGNFDEVISSIAKMFTTVRLREAVAAGRAICGGNGILLENDIARFFADAEALFTYEGTYEMNALIIGRSVTGKSAFV